MLRFLARKNAKVERVVPQALRHLAHFPLRRMPLFAMLDRMWELRHNATVHDAAYVALAEHLGAELLTCDTKFDAIPQKRCKVTCLS